MTERDPLNPDKTPDPDGKDVYGVEGKAAEAPNKAWEGREPFPQDVGGINHPGHGGEVGVDPLTGDRGSAGSEPPAGVQTGKQAVRQDGGAFTAREASRGMAPSGQQGDRTAEGGFEPRAYQGQHDRPAETRNFLEKAKDEAAALLGDEDAKRRLAADKATDEAAAQGGGDWQGHDDDTGWRDPVTDADAKLPDAAPREHRPGLFRDEQGR